LQALVQAWCRFQCGRTPRHLPDSLLNTPVQGDAWAATLMEPWWLSDQWCRGAPTSVVHSPPVQPLGSAATTTDSIQSPPHYRDTTYPPISTPCKTDVADRSGCDHGAFNYDDASHKGSITIPNCRRKLTSSITRPSTGLFYLPLRHCDRNPASFTHNVVQTLPGYPITQPSRISCCGEQHQTIDPPRSTWQRSSSFAAGSSRAALFRFLIKDYSSVRIQTPIRPLAGWSIADLQIPVVAAHLFFNILLWAPTG